MAAATAVVAPPPLSERRASLKNRLSETNHRRRELKPLHNVSNCEGSDKRESVCVLYHNFARQNVSTFDGHAADVRVHGQ